MGNRTPDWKAFRGAGRSHTFLTATNLRTLDSVRSIVDLLPDRWRLKGRNRVGAFLHPVIAWRL